METFFITSGECVLGFEEKDGQLQQILFDTDQNAVSKVSIPCFALTVAGLAEGNYSALTRAYTSLPHRFQASMIEKRENGLVVSFFNEALNLEITLRYEAVSKANGFLVTTSAKNLSGKELALTYLSNAALAGIANDGNLSWYDENKIRVTYLSSTWEGEAQVRSDSLENLGLYRTSVHPSAGSVRIGSVGSWSTGRYIPVLFVENMETKKIWFFETDISASWEHELSYSGGWEKEEGTLTFRSSCVNERNGGFVKTLKPDEEFFGARTFVGCCNGNINEAAKSLTDYRRHLIQKENVNPNLQKLFFNDYMNCLWANPTEEKLIPLIDSAAAAGMEGFCIDAGWYTEIGGDWSCLGDWNISKSRFPVMGLSGILRYIKSKGMIPGLWLEMEMCSENAELYKMPDSFFLMRHGKRVGGAERIPLNFSNAEVRDYLFQKIDQLIKMGVGFFKNDYNMCAGVGDDTMSSAGEGLYRNALAFYSFIKELKSRYPELIIENCGSGAMRQDYGILSLCDMQSVSDQEEYQLMPSIVTGQLLCVLPEQLGIWAYPNPLLFLDRDHPEVLDSDEYRKEMEDGEQTIFNMVTSLCGVPYLSGRIDKADEFNMQLVTEAADWYKENRAFLSHAYPYYTSGFLKLSSKTMTSFALINQEKTKLLLFVWRLDCDMDQLTVPLPFFKEKKPEITKVFPQDIRFHQSYSWDEKTGELLFDFPKKNTARLFQIRL